MDQKAIKLSKSYLNLRLPIELVNLILNILIKDIQCDYKKNLINEIPTYYVNNNTLGIVFGGAVNDKMGSEKKYGIYLKDVIENTNASKYLYNYIGYGIRSIIFYDTEYATFIDLINILDDIKDNKVSEITFDFDSIKILQYEYEYKI
jgi:hypothetical protein